MASTLRHGLHALALLVGLSGLAVGGGAPRARADVGSTTAPVKLAGRDSVRTRPLPFLPAPRPDQPFAASELTKPYVKNFAPLLKPRPRSTSIREVERYAAAAYRDTSRDSSNVHLVDAAKHSELTPEEKAKAVPKKPGAHVGIPGPAAAAGALLGGLALLVKVIAALVR
jgi:hypothetical protein